MLVLLHSEGNMKIIAQEVLCWLASQLELVVQLGELFHGQFCVVGDDISIINVHQDVNALVARKELAEVARIELGLLQYDSWA